MIFLLLYAYIGATVAAMAWGMTDEMSESETRGVMLAAAVAWPAILPVILVIVLRERSNKATRP